MTEQNPFIFDLSETVEFAKDGDFSKTASIELKGPSMQTFDLSSQLSQLIMQAMIDIQELQGRFRKEELSSIEEAGEIDGKAIRMVLMASKNVSFSEISEVAKKLFVKVGTYDGKTPIKKIFFDRISINDFTSMVCGYIANFIFPSLL